MITILQKWICIPISYVPENSEESFYHGKVFVCCKDAVFEPSSPNHHMAELYKLIDDKPILFLYCNGRCQLIALFLKLDLDYLCVCRTAPFHWWKNPVERVMSVVNLGLQSVGLMRQQTDEECEALITKCNSMEHLRQAAKRRPELQGKVLDSIVPIKIMLSDIINRLQWNKYHLKCSPGTVTQIRELWQTVKEIDSTLVFHKKDRKDTLKEFPHSKRVHFSLLSKLSHIPDPVPGTDGQYLPFTDVNRKTDTDEQH